MTRESLPPPAVIKSAWRGNPNGDAVHFGSPKCPLEPRSRRLARSIPISAFGPDPTKGTPKWLIDAPRVPGLE